MPYSHADALFDPLPANLGFGSSLLKATLGGARVDHAEEGLVYEVDVPSSAILPPPGYSRNEVAGAA